MSPSNDLRLLGPMALRPGAQRLILNNGSHRAFTLRQMGVTHVPCIVQHVSSRDELEVVASSAVRRNSDL